MSEQTLEEEGKHINGQVVKSLTENVSGGVPRWFAWVMTFYIVISITFMMTFAALALQSTNEITTPAMVFLNEFEKPRLSDYCPGDVMEVDLHWKTVRSHSVMRLFTSWYNVSDHFEVIPTNQVTYSIMSSDASGLSHYSIQVPYLSAGSYEYRIAVEGKRSEASVVRVPFSVPTVCFK